MRRRRRFDAAEWQRANAAAPVPPAQFRLPDTEIARSSLAGRLVVAWDHGAGEPAEQARQALGPDAHVLEPGSGLFDRGLLRLWTDAQWVTHMGPAVMVTPEQVLGTLRRLTDRLLMAAAPDAPVVVDVVAPALLPRAMVASLYPDARQLELGSPGAASGRGAPSAIRRPPAAMPAATSPRATGRLAPAPDGLAAASVPAVLVILASARSGTTWLSRLLQVHPRVGGIDDAETWLFEMLSPLWASVHDDGSLGAHVDAGECAAALRAACDELFAGAVARHAPGADVFVEKTPVHVRHLDLLGAVYPDARYLHLVRDGRDVTRSLLDMPMAELPNAGAAAAAWQEAIQAVRDSAPGLEHVLEVRYEELVADPVGGVTAILEWMGCPVDDETRTTIGRAAAERVSTWSGLRSAVGGESWRAMSPWHLARAYAVAGETLAAEGYLDAGERRALRRHPRFIAARLLERVAWRRRR